MPFHRSSLVRLCAGACFLSFISAFASGSTYLPLAFEENQGQAQDEVRYLVRTRTGTLLFSPERVLFHRSAKAGDATLTLQFAHSNATTRVTGVERLAAKVNYFLGSPDKWHVGIPTYRKVKYSALYPGIDAIFHDGPSSATPLEFDMVVAPHAKPQNIRLIITAQKTASVRILPQGDLAITAGSQTMTFQKPSVWQESARGLKQRVEAAFIKYPDNSIGFHLGAYDKNKSMTIDPAIGYSTFLGGTDDEGTFSIKRDTSGNIYVAGETSSADFPILGPGAGPCCWKLRPLYI